MRIDCNKLLPATTAAPLEFAPPAPPPPPPQAATHKQKNNEEMRENFILTTHCLTDLSSHSLDSGPICKVGQMALRRGEFYKIYKCILSHHTHESCIRIQRRSNTTPCRFAMTTLCVRPRVVMAAAKTSFISSRANWRAFSFFAMMIIRLPMRLP